MTWSGPYSIVVTDEIGQVVGRLYRTLSDDQRERMRAGGVWPVVREVLDSETVEASWATSGRG